MKLHLLDRSSLENHSFKISHHSYPNFIKVWHYHPELELVAILQSSGTRFIGDNIEQFKKGEVVLIGKDLPHMWLNDKEYFKGDINLTAQAKAIHFKECFAGEGFLKMPEMSYISSLLKNSRYGIKFLGDTTSIIKQINKLEKLSGVDKAVCFIQLLNLLAVHQNFDLLSSVGFVDSFKMSGEKNLGEVYEFIIKNFKENISLNDVAKVANMNPSAFSRFFKRVNRKTYSEYLNRVRVGYACKLLIEEKYSISEICFDSGFNNISNFNRQFKKTMNYSPSDYMKLHLKKKV